MWRRYLAHRLLQVSPSTKQSCYGRQWPINSLAIRADKKRDITMALFEMRKTVNGILKSGAAIVVAGVSLAMAPNASAQSSTGTLTVTATVASSIGLTFETDGSGVALTGAGTS